MVKRCPGLKPRLFEENGMLKSYIEVYVNEKSMYPSETARVVVEGDQIRVVEAIAGG